jgi:hypothetical protein
MPMHCLQVVFVNRRSIAGGMATSVGNVGRRIALALDAFGSSVCRWYAERLAPLPGLPVP